jgi:hypothetical protein
MPSPAFSAKPWINFSLAPDGLGPTPSVTG